MCMSPFNTEKNASSFYRVKAHESNTALAQYALSVLELVRSIIDPVEKDFPAFWAFPPQ